MSVGHAHSHRPRRRRLNAAERDIARVLLNQDGRQRALARAQRRLARLERRRQRVAEGPRQVVVVLPTFRAKPDTGRFYGNSAGPSRWVREALARQAAEAAR